MSAVDDEIQRVNERTRQMIAAYLEWGDKLQFGSTYQMMHGDIIDFVNFRVETAEACLELIEKRKIADALGLGRSLLEHYLLLMLICRGNKYFQLQNFDRKTPEEFAKIFDEQKASLEERHQSGDKGAPLYVAKYPRAARHLMHVFEGLYTQDDDDDTFISIHYFQFQEFNPEAMRLKDENYFEYFEPSDDLKRARKKHRGTATYIYRHYLSYDALLQCLELNGLVNDDVLARIEAHYTFLGRTLHPTHNAARNLHVGSNQFSGKPAIGMGQEYSGAAVLLASLYVCFCLAGILDEIAGLIEAAPVENVRDAATAEIRALTTSVPKDFPYFWFLFNEAPLYDKFNYAIHHVDDEELAKYSDYEGVPSDVVTFDHDIYRHLSSAIGAWSNIRVGRYESPLER
jgi:hypothetical protein